MVEAVRRIQVVLEEFFEAPKGSAKFVFLRSWAGYPGWVFNITMPHKQYGMIDFDINLAYTPGHFGIEHARRFNRYFDRVLAELGPDTAVQLIEDIRRVKKQGKNYARRRDGWIDRTQKIPGLVVEGLFTHQFPPYDYPSLMALILNHQWEPGCEPSDHWVGDQADQIVDAGFNFTNLLNNLACENDSLSKGAWENLVRIAQASL